MKQYLQRSIAALVIIYAMIVLSCGAPNYIAQLRVGLTVTDAFLASLDLGDRVKGVAADFRELVDDIDVLARDIEACNKARPCQLEAINKFQIHYFDVLRHGHFKLSPKLEKVQEILSAVIDAAKVYFGGSLSISASKSSDKQAETELRTRLAELKAATR